MYSLYSMFIGDFVFIGDFIRGETEGDSSEVPGYV